jgi:hypothetical protein
MPELTLEALAKRVEDLERRMAEMATPPAKDWRKSVGMFTGSEFQKRVDEEALKIREADREAARREFGEWSSSTPTI